MAEQRGGWRLLARAARLRCPACGQGHLFRTYFSPRERCDVCNFLFARDNEYGQEGYFTGAMAINLVITGLVPMVALIVVVLTGRLSMMPTLVAGVTWTILFPILFYPYACALWAAIDHLLNPPTAAELAGQQVAGPPPSPLDARRRRTPRSP